MAPRSKQVTPDLEEEPFYPDVPRDDPTYLQNQADIQNFADELEGMFSTGKQLDRQSETEGSTFSANAPLVIQDFLKGFGDFSEAEVQELTKLDPEVLRNFLEDVGYVKQGLSSATPETILQKYRIGDWAKDLRQFQTNPSLEMAEGGLVENQMEFKFSNGGMLDDGIDIEPSTGNEVPPGSLSEEVADEVDAKLSPGEYVLPADVVQFYGLEKIEKLVEKAKKGLGDLESNDRIKSPKDEEELPFGDDELLAEDSEEEPSFAAGGFLGGGPNSGVQTINYVGPNGDTVPILFINGMPIQAIPQGYAPQGQNPTEATPEFKSNRKKGLIPSTSDDRDDGRTGADPRHTNPELWDTDYFEKYLDQEGVTKAMTAVMGMVAPPIGAAMRSGYRRTGEKALEELDRRLASDEVDEASKERLRAVREQYESLGEGKDERGGFLGLPDKGILGSLIDGENPFEGMFSTKRAQQETADRVNPAGATRTSAGSPYVSKPSASSDSRSYSPPSNFKSGSSSDDRTYSSSPSAKTKTVKSGASVSTLPSGTRTATSRGTTTKVSAGESNPGGFDKKKGSWSTGPMADGGYVAPRKKKKK